jgi:hypothetical protein
MADSSTPLDSAGHLLITANMGAGDSGYGVMYYPFAKGLLSRGSLIDSQNSTPFGPIIGSEFLMRDIADSGTSIFLSAKANSYGQQLIMALDSDASNASGGEGGGGGGITQYWIG